jgi:hypothetical protein
VLNVGQAIEVLSGHTTHRFFVIVKDLLGQFAIDVVA